MVPDAVIVIHCTCNNSEVCRACRCTHADLWVLTMDDFLPDSTKDYNKALC